MMRIDKEKQTHQLNRWTFPLSNGSATNGLKTNGLQTNGLQTNGQHTKGPMTTFVPDTAELRLNYFLSI